MKCEAIEHNHNPKGPKPISDDLDGRQIAVLVAKCIGGRFLNCCLDLDSETLDGAQLNGLSDGLRLGKRGGRR